MLGVQNEMRIAELLRENRSLIHFGICLEVRASRVLVTEYIQRNNDNRTSTFDYYYYHYNYSFNVRYFRAYAGQTFSP